jgi:hypothetical protein
MARAFCDLNHRRQVAPGKSTWSLLNQWAQDHDQAFPDLPGDANVNFRLLFQSGITDDEKPFGTPGDGLCLPGKPDGRIGTAPDFAQALEPGELSIAYVAGLNGSSNSNLPMLVHGAGTAVDWIMGTAPKPAAPTLPFKVVVVSAGGSALARSEGDIGKPADPFAPGSGHDPTNVRLPAPVPRVGK